MKVSPTLEEFRTAAVERRVIPVHTRLMADTLTPVGLYAKLAANRPGTFLFESAEHGSWGRWSFVGVHAAATLTTRDGQTHWEGNVPVGVPTEGDPLEVLDRTVELLHTERDPDLPPFTSGMVGYLGYDIIRRLENLPDTNPDDLGVPELRMSLATDLAVLDHFTGEVWLIANAINFDATDERVDAAHADAVRRVEQMAEALARPTPALAGIRDTPAEPKLRHQRTSAEYAAAVAEIIERIEAGEAFQVVFSQRFDIDTEADAFDIYRMLRTSNPSPYLYLLRMPGFDIVGSSPEALVTVSDRRAITRPIAGTRPRGSTPAEDAQLETDLLADEKECAEHLMLVDLGRNDLGRVCEPGTVEVTQFMKVRRYSHVMHLEAEVTGRLREEHSALRAVLSCFPAGTLSGAPKVRAMEIIDTLETSRRGVYGGVVGYFDFAGDADVAIAIRTALIKDGIAHVQAGGGIVADSVVEAENAESRNKAAAVIRAIAAAESLRPVTQPEAP
ncbi:anthranilate synthase component I [Enemella sp. A6]|uniref:anthranilate synthase component I n=1 Tax=Enemella sp. A6 TaxID=3440152 RepID=UPI003EBD5363